MSVCMSAAEVRATVIHGAILFADKRKSITVLYNNHTRNFTYRLHQYNNILTITRKLCCRKETVRCRTVLFGSCSTLLVSPTTYTTRSSAAKLRKKPCFRAPNIYRRKTEFNAKWPLNFETPKNTFSITPLL